MYAQNVPFNNTINIDIATTLSDGNMTVGVPAVSTCFCQKLQKTDEVHLVQQTKR